MNFTDIVPLSYANKTLSYYQVGASDVSTSGTAAQAYDHNNSTYFNYYVHHSGDGTVEGTIDFQVFWAVPTTIYRLYANATAQMDGGNFFTARGSEFDFKSYLFYSGAWNVIGNSGAIQNGKAGDGAQPYNWISDVSNTWTGVTGCRIFMHVLASSYEGNRNQYGWLYLNELNCYREKMDEGFRIKTGNGGVVRVGSRTVQSTDNLRFHKNDTTVGIPLVATTDPQASPIRIKTAAGVKSLILAD